VAENNAPPRKAEWTAGESPSRGTVGRRRVSDDEKAVLAGFGESLRTRKVFPREAGETRAERPCRRTIEPRFGE